MNVPCEVIQDLLPLYCDGVCSGKSREMVEDHLRTCENCKRDHHLMAADTKTASVHADDEKAARAASTAWKRGRRKTFWAGCLIMLSAVLILAGVHAGFHWFSSADGDDPGALARQAADYFKTGELTVTKTAQRGDCFAALCTDSRGKWYMCQYDRDKLFAGRWYANGGTLDFNAGDIGSWNYGSPQGESVLIFWGAGLPGDACWYTFQNSGITYTCPIENHAVLDIFIVPDSSDINGFPTALDGNQQPLKNN